MNQRFRTHREAILRLARQHGAQNVRIYVVTEASLHPQIRERVLREAVPLE